MKKKKVPNIIQLRDKLDDNHVFANENFAKMGFLSVKVAANISNDVPGFVRCEFTDIDGNLHIIEEKVPILSDQDWNENTTYPL